MSARDGELRVLSPLVTHPWSISTLKVACLFIVGTMGSVVIVWTLLQRDMSVTYGCNTRRGDFSHADLHMNNRESITATPASSWDYNWDKRAWKSQEEAAGKATRTLILVRHGHYDKKTGILTDLGRGQANLTGRRLKEMNIEYDNIFHSHLPRAKETAQIIHRYLKQVKMKQDEFIEEGGPMEPKPTLTHFKLPDMLYHLDGPRLEAAFRKYFHRADKQQQRHTHDILVGHGNCFRFFVLRALQLPPEAWMRVFIPHASITILHINADSTVYMDHFGDSGFMPANKITY